MHSIFQNLLLQLLLEMVGLAEPPPVAGALAPLSATGRATRCRRCAAPARSQPQLKSVVHVAVSRGQSVEKSKAAASLLTSPAPGMAGTRVGIAGALAEACASCAVEPADRGRLIACDTQTCYWVWVWVWGG